MAEKTVLWSRYVEGGGVGCASGWWEWIEVIASSKGLRLRAGISQPHELRFSKPGINDAATFIDAFEGCVAECFSEFVSSSIRLPEVRDILADLREVDDALAESVETALTKREAEEDEEEIVPQRRPVIISIHGLTTSAFERGWKQGD